MADTPTPETRNLSPGEQLRNARQGYRWSVEDVAANLNLTVDVVRALESGDSEVLPGPTFVRGYLRAYARLMEIDESTVLAEADGPAGESIGSVVPILGKEAFKDKKGRQWLKFSTSQKKGWRKTALVSILILAGILVAWWFSGLLPTFQELNGDSTINSQSSGTISIPLNTQN
jgi:cytoskeletal protein RodZ